MKIPRHIPAAALLAAVLATLQPLAAHAQNMQGPGPGPGQREAGPAGLDQLSAWERQDRGVQAPRGLHEGAFHGPTPNQLPGGQVITTKGLMPLLQQGVPVLVFDVLGGPQSLPNAIPAAWASQPGSFDDNTQQQLGQMLGQATRGRNDVPLVFYCQSPDCWMSYNAAVRAVRLGYRNVLWYRGGIEAWRNAGLPLVAAGPGGQQQGPQQGQQPGTPGGRPPGALPPDAFGPTGGRS